MLVRHGFPIVHDAEGAATGGGATTEAATTTTATTEAATTAAETVAARPDWLPEKFWDGDGKAAKVEDLAKSYAALETWKGTKAETLKAEVLAALREGVPEKPDGYALELPKDLLPPGFEAQINPADPFLAQMRQTFHDLGAKPEQFNAAAGAFLQWQVANMPDVAAEKMKLGEGADERLGAVDMWLAKSLAEPEYKAVMNGMVTAEGVLAMEKLMKLATGGGMQGVPGGGNAALTAEEAAGMVADPDYRLDNPRGAQLRRQFGEFVAKGGKLPGFTRG